MKIISIFTLGFNSETYSNDYDDVLVEPPTCFELPDWSGPAGTIGEINCPRSDGYYSIGTTCNYVCPPGKLEKPNFSKLQFIIVFTCWLKYPLQIARVVFDK